MVWFQVKEIPVQYPYVFETDILVSMSQEAYNKYIIDLKKDGILLTDSDLVDMETQDKTAKSYAIPSTRFAEDMGNRIFANIIMVGFFTAITKVLEPDAVLNALPGSVPSRFIEKNKEAFKKGYEFGINELNQ